MFSPILKMGARDENRSDAQVRSETARETVLAELRFGFSQPSSLNCELEDVGIDAVESGLVGRICP
jgi:hypothetical protein